MRNPVIRFRIDFAENSYVGPGKIDLLEAIRDSGSLSQAARDLGMSYRRAWLLVDSFKIGFREPVTSATTGGKGGGGVALTQFGEGLVDSYRALEREFAALAARRLRTQSAAVRRASAPRTAAARRPLARSTARR
jgi:molybdate transport system regulatory protein